jgi:NADH-quinone oxidoreductase subunit C
MPASSSDKPDKPNEPAAGKVDEKTAEDLSQKIKNMLSDNFPDEIDEILQDGHMYFKPDKWLEIATWLKTESSLLFDSLQCQMGIDVGEDILESRYNLHSMVHDHYLEVRIRVARSNAKIPSVEQVWRIADWFERETYDMLGIEYVGHRDLRRILLPDDWEGWPLRKDYQEQETYHGIVVPKTKEGWE